MKRPLLIIAICILLGAIVNVAVAWGLVFRANFIFKHSYGIAIVLPTLDWPSNDEAARLWEAEIGLPPEALSVAVATNPGITLVEFSHGDVVRGMASIRHVVMQGGWPMRAMRGEMDYAGPTRLRDMAVAPAFLARRTGAGAGLPLLPLRPIWPGFALNTIFYAALLWLLIPGPFALRRFQRVRRGLCPKCAYPMGESSVCTECGCGLPKRASTP